MLLVFKTICDFEIIYQLEKKLCRFRIFNAHFQNGRTLKMGFLKLSSLSEVDFSLHAIFRFSIAKNLGLETQLWIFYVCCAAPKKD